VWNLQKSSKFHARGATGHFSVKNYPKNNFSNEPIYTNNIPIRSARLAETQKLQNFFKIRFGKQPGHFRENSPLNNFQKLPWGSVSPKIPKSRPGIGIFSLNNTMNKFSTVHAIFGHIGSIGAPWRKTVKNFDKITKNLS
jgi:hypothetical protein